MKIVKKNQVVLFVIGLMLITAGYFNFIDTKKLNNEDIQTSGESIGDATYVSSNAVIDNDKEESLKEAKEEEILEAVSSEDLMVNVKENDEYYIASKIERDNMYSQMIESYQKMIDSSTITAEQKAIAQNEITKINNTKNAIMITENLLKTKGFSNLVVLVNDESVNVIIEGENLTHEEIAQVQNIVSREMKTEIENIHICSK